MLILPNRRTVKLNDGYTYEDYVIKLNEDNSSVNHIGKALGLKPAEVTARYDKLSVLDLDDIGTRSELEREKRIRPTPAEMPAPDRLGRIVGAEYVQEKYGSHKMFVRAEDGKGTHIWAGVGNGYVPVEYYDN